MYEILASVEGDRTAANAWQHNDSFGQVNAVEIGWRVRMKETRPLMSVDEAFRIVEFAWIIRGESACCSNVTVDREGIDPGEIVIIRIIVK